MSRQISIDPDISIIFDGDRKRILDTAQTQKDLADLVSENNGMPVPPFIRDSLK